MEDRQIVELFLQRQEAAVTEAQGKYRAYCLSVAGSILLNREDAEEVVNDAFLAAWKSIPPQQPENLAAYLGKLARRIAVDRLRQQNAKKRGSGETELALEELGEILPSDSGDPVSEMQRKELEESIRRFTASLTSGDKRLFLARYWYVRPISAFSGFGKS